MIRSKKVALAAIAVGALALAGCSSSSSSETSSDEAATAASSAAASAAASSEAPAQTKPVVFVPGVTGDVFYTSMECGVIAEAAAQGVDASTQGPTKFDATLQRPVLESVIATDPGAIIIAPTDAEAMKRPIQEATDKGIAVILVDTTLADTSGTFAQISSDNVEGGRTAFEAIEQLVPEGGKVLAIGNKPGITTTDERLQGFKEGVDGNSAFELLDFEYNDNDPAKTAQIVSAALQANPDLVGIFAATQPAATGAATGIQQLGKQGEVKLVAFDASPDLAEALRSDAIQALVAQQPGQMGVDAVKQAVAAMAGDPAPGAQTTGFTILTKDNIDTAEGAAAIYSTTCS